MRDSYIANILTQVIERHFMRGLSKLTPEVRELDAEEFKRLVEEDSKIEQERADLKKRIDELQKCLDILEQSGWR
jgi:sialic acid synthase SpsE